MVQFAFEKKPKARNVFVKFDDKHIVGWDGWSGRCEGQLYCGLCKKHKNPPCLFCIDGTDMPSTNYYDSFRFHFFFFGQAAMACLFFMSPEKRIFWILPTCAFGRFGGRFGPKNGKKSSEKSGKVQKHTRKD